MPKPLPKPTESELEILHVLWQHGASTVRFINEQLSQRREVGYTTTLKLLQLMHEKGLVSRDDTSRTHVFAAAVRERETQGLLLDKFVDSAFGGSALKLVLQALGGRPTSREELAQIRTLLTEIEQDQHRPLAAKNASNSSTPTPPSDNERA
ncbi:BlaI/MecI/CopY family transcriptional regulator [uncultured Hymenobacter sp.]|uniref:BlaI/MecI/CopY family transcriptional regulator n=1 Tax=uncultured Hymenobacter sp. TaxID=170016 RepID=UPI0035CBDB64